MVKKIISDRNEVYDLYCLRIDILKEALIGFNEEHNTEYTIDHNGLETGIFVGTFPFSDNVETLHRFVINNGFKRCSWYGNATGSGLWLILKSPDGFEWDNYGNYYLIVK
jgi:hypothetical protein